MSSEDTGRNALIIGLSDLEIARIQATCSLLGETMEGLAKRLLLEEAAKMSDDKESYKTN